MWIKEELLRDEFTLIKQYVSSAETQLARADREWAYYKNGHPKTKETQPHYIKSQWAYAAAKNYAEKALALLKKTPNSDLERRANAIISKCNQNK